MLQKRTPHCYYVDHSFYSARKIGGIYSKLSQQYSREDLGDSIILATCQRIEVYTPFDRNPLSNLALPFRHISGQDEVKKRLVRIGVGVESQILGERNVYYQLQNAFRDVDDRNELKELFSEALEEAHSIRNEKAFYADMNYEDISLAIMREVLKGGGIGGVGLVIVGSGMLARNFLEQDLFSIYGDIRFITRSPRNLKKKFEKDMKHCVLRGEEFCAQDYGPYHCIIATNGLENDNYADTICPILMSDGCLGVFDLSASPLFPDKLESVFYADTYSDVYLKHVDVHNDCKRDEAGRIRDEIMEGIKVKVAV